MTSSMEIDAQSIIGGVHEYDGTNWEGVINGSSTHRIRGSPEDQHMNTSNVDLEGAINGSSTHRIRGPPEEYGMNTSNVDLEDVMTDTDVHVMGNNVTVGTLLTTQLDSAKSVRDAEQEDAARTRRFDNQSTLSARHSAKDAVDIVQSLISMLMKRTPSATENVSVTGGLVCIHGCIYGLIAVYTHICESVTDARPQQLKMSL